MKLRTAFMYVLLLYAAGGFAQIKTRNTYAVVIGIAAYENKNIRQLVYSNKDAQLFVQWLQSAGGGNVPAANIRLLLNEQATIAAIYNALDWLKQQCNEGDDVYFYFSGHGDIETNDQQNKGYLLAYNTPPHNYPNNAVSVEQLNADANFLTLQKKARVVIITDACHSGKLAGDFFKGKQWVAQQLQQVLSNEIRMAACAADEEAAEGEFWDGGRGVFSYYLLKGLYGMADVVKDKQITFQELQQYISTSFTTDEYLQLLKHKQVPVTDGNPLLVMATVDTTTVQKFQHQNNERSVLQPIEQFFKHAALYPLESFIDFNSFPVFNEPSFPYLLIEQCIKQDSIDNTTQDVTGKPSTLLTPYSDTLRLLKNELLTNTALHKQFNEQFAELVQNSAQAMTNAYLNGEEAELEKRQYYYSGARNYNDFLPMIKVALQLIPANHHLAEVLQINLNYLSGVLARIQMATSKKKDSLVKAAFRFQYKTLELEPYAAYVHNELANLYVHQKKFDSAQYHFDMASALAATWAIPWSNQIRMNIMLKNNAKAKIALHKADSLQPNLSYVYMNAGLLMEREQKPLEAISYYLRAAKLNPVHYLSFERLGHLYLQAGDFEQSNIYFTKAASLKNDFAVNDAYFTYGVELGGFPPMEAFVFLDSCFFKSSSNEINSTIVRTLLRTIALQKNVAADSIINTLGSIIRKQPSVLLAHHYLGKKLVETGKYKEAIPILKEAISRYATDSALLSYFHLLTATNEFTECMTHVLPVFNYDKREDYYLLARAYEKEQLFTQAIAAWEQAAAIENIKLEEQAIFKDYEKNFELEVQKSRYADISPEQQILFLYESPVQTVASVQLMRLYEQLQQYEKAEAVLLQQVAKNRNAGNLRGQVSKKVPGTDQLTGITINFFWIKANRDLEITIHDFYTRMMKLQPRNFYWKQQAALFLYHRLEMAYNQLPQELYISFTNDFINHAYPWGTSDELYKPQQAVWSLSALDDTILIETPAFHPVESALTFMQQAQTLSPDTMPDFETALLFADMNNWKGNDTASAKWYEYALSLKPKDSVTRNKFVRLLLYAGYHSKAQLQLDTLVQLHQIDSTGLQELIFFHTVSGNYTKASALIHQSSSTSITDSCRNILQKATILQVQKQYNKVIELLQNKYPRFRFQSVGYYDSIQLQQMLFTRYYIIARCYALLKQDGLAVSYLKKAFKGGFDYDYILSNDPAWITIKKGAHKKIFQLTVTDEENNNEEAQGLYNSINPINYRIPGESKRADYLIEIYRTAGFRLLPKL
jgi:tetratricopeptide (TPR) repeat protein/uncharacterized caspase-like protein